MWLKVFIMLIISLLSIFSVYAALCKCNADCCCSGLNPDCEIGGCTPSGSNDGLCVPEFSGYASIAALIGAIGIPVLVSRFKKRKI
jgi:hypothetical protein